MQLRIALLGLSLLATGFNGLLAAPADYNAISGYGTEIPRLTQAANDVSIVNIQLAGETTEPDGRIRLSFTASLQNSGDSYYESARIAFDPPGPGWPVEIVDDTHMFADIAPQSTVAMPETIVLLAPAADALAVKNAVLAGQRLRATATELFQFRLPPVAVDEATGEAYDSATENLLTRGVTLIFSESTPLLAGLQPGTLLMEVPFLHTLPRVFDMPPPGEKAKLIGLAKHVSSSQYVMGAGHSIRTDRMVEVTSVTFEGDGSVRVHGQQFGGPPPDWLFNPLVNFWHSQTDPDLRGFVDNLRHGTLSVEAIDAFDPPADGDPAARDPFDPPAGNTAFTYLENLQLEIERNALLNADQVRHPRLSELNGFFALHMPINDLKITRGITVDGQVLLQGMKVGIDVRYSGLLPVRVTVRLGSELELNLRVTVNPGTDNNGLAEIEREKQIVDFGLPTIYFSIAGVPVKVQPRFSAKVGVTASVPTQVVLPFTGSYEAGVEWIWDLTKPPGMQVSSEPFSEHRPLTLSKPQIADSLALNVTAWAEARASLIINDIAGPYIGPRANFNFSVTPFASDWWEADADVDILSGFSIRLLGFELADPVIATFNGPNLFSTDSDGPATRGSAVGQPPPGPLDPAEGGDVRWAKTLQWNNDGPAPYTAQIIRSKLPGVNGETFLIAPNAFEVAPPVVSLDKRGNPLWARGVNFLFPRKIAATPDGGVIAYCETTASAQVIARFSQSGTVLWVKGAVAVNDDPGQTAKLTKIASVIIRPTTPGDFEILLVGDVNNDATIFDNDPVVMRFDDDGNALASHRFASTNMLESVRDAILLQDGGLLLAGEARGNSDGTPINAGAEWGGWLMKVDPTDWDVVWSVRSKPAITWTRVVENPDGVIFTAGNFAPIITADIPAMAVGRYLPDGTIDRMISLCEPTVDSTAFIDGPDKGVRNYPNATEWLEDSGYTPHDLLHTLAWTPNGLAIGGVTGNGDNTAPISALLTEKLSVRWMVTHEGDGSPDATVDMLLEDEGIYYLTLSKSFGNSGGLPILTLAKQPYEGTVPYHLSTHALVKYLQPSVYDLLGGNWTIDVPSPPQGYEETEDFTSRYTLQSLTTLPAPPLPEPSAFQDISGFLVRDLHLGNPHAPMNYAQWRDYMQLAPNAAPDADSDGDLVSDWIEYLLAGNPHTPDMFPPAILGISRRPDGGIRLHTLRSHAVGMEYTPMQYVTHLGSEMWQPLGELPEDWQPEPSLPSDPANTRRLHLDLNPDTSPRRFFRMLLEP